MAVFGLTSLMTFFVIYFFFSQRIYSLVSFPLAVSLSLIIPLIFILLNTYKLNTLTILNIGLLIFYYILFLFFVKLFYKRLNNYFVSKKIIDRSFLNKDFTFVNLTEFNGDIWDDKLATKPSTFDHIISIALLFLPILAFIAIHTILK